MPFPSVSQVPTSIGTIRIRLMDEDGVPGNMRVFYNVEIYDQNGAPIQFPGAQGDLQPHLTPAQISALVSFMEAMRTKAETEWLA